MQLNELELNDIYYMLLTLMPTESELNQEAFSFASEVKHILRLGNTNPGKDTGHVGKHLNHAEQHWILDGNDDTTGLSHKAHCAARLILALLELMKEGEIE